MHVDAVPHSMLCPPGSTSDVFCPMRFMGMGTMGQYLCLMYVPYLNDDSQRQGGHWPGDTVNGKTRKKSGSAVLFVCILCVRTCVRVCV